MSDWRRWIWMGLLAAVAAGVIWLLVREPEGGGEGETVVEGDGGGETDETNEALQGDVDTRGGTDADDVDARTVKVQLAKTLRGVVTDEAGAPIAAEVVVATMDPRSVRGFEFPDGPDVGNASCDVDGRFEVDVPGETWLRVTASHRGFARTAVRTASRGAFLTIRMARACDLTIDVVLPDGAPAAGAGVTIRSGELVAVAATDANGVVSRADLPPGACQIDAELRNVGRANARINALHPDRETRITMVLDRAVAISGFVVDTTNDRPIADARVWIAKDGRSVEAGTTDAHGRFSAPALGSERDRVFAYVIANGFRPRLQAISLDAKRTRGAGAKDVTIFLEAGQDWKGSVHRMNGDAAVGIPVRYSNPGLANAPDIETVTDAQGQFVLPPPPDPLPGHRVCLAAEDPTTGAMAVLALRPNANPPDPLALTLRSGGVVAGRFVGSDGKPLQGAQIRLVPNWRDLLRAPSTPATDRLRLANEEGLQTLSTATDNAGWWRLEQVPASSYRVSARWPGGTFWSPEPITIPTDGLNMGTVTVDTGSPMAGRVLQSNGSPAVGAIVTATGLDRDARQRGRTITDANGEFSILGLAPGDYRLRADLGGRRSATVDTTLSTDVRLDMPSGASLELDIRHASDVYRGPLRVALIARNRGKRAFQQSIVVRAGKGLLSDVPPGSYLVDLTTPSGVGARESITLTPDEVATLTVDLTKRATLEGRVLDAGGASVADADVEVRSDLGSRKLTTDNNGAFFAYDLSDGPYDVLVRGRGGAPTQATILVTVGEVAPLTLTLLPSGAARVRVVDESNKPVPGAVCLFRAEGAVVRSRRPDMTNAQGEVTRTGLPVGRIRVTARGPGGKRGSAQVDVTKGSTADALIQLVTRTSTAEGDNASGR